MLLLNFNNFTVLFLALFGWVLVNYSLNKKGRVASDGLLIFFYGLRGGPRGFGSVNSSNWWTLCGVLGSAIPASFGVFCSAALFLILRARRSSYNLMELAPLNTRASR